jgi:hypothetical protein
VSPSKQKPLSQNLLENLINLVTSDYLPYNAVELFAHRGVVVHFENAACHFSRCETKRYVVMVTNS